MVQAPARPGRFVAQAEIPVGEANEALHEIHRPGLRDYPGIPVQGYRCLPGDGSVQDRAANFLYRIRDAVDRRLQPQDAERGTGTWRRVPKPQAHYVPLPFRPDEGVQATPGTGLRTAF